MSDPRGKRPRIGRDHLTEVADVLASVTTDPDSSHDVRDAVRHIARRLGAIYARAIGDRFDPERWQASTERRERGTTALVATLALCAAVIVAWALWRAAVIAPPLPIDERGR